MSVSSVFGFVVGLVYTPKYAYLALTFHY